MADANVGASALKSPVTPDDVELLFDALLKRTVNNEGWKLATAKRGIAVIDFIKEIRKSGELKAKMIAEAGATLPSVSQIDDYRFRLPQQMAVSPNDVKNVLLIGSCLFNAWKQVLESQYSRLKVDRITFNNASVLPDMESEAAASYDFQLLQVPLRSVLKEAAFFSIRPSNDAAYNELFERCCHLTRLNYEALVRYNREFNIETYVIGFYTTIQNPLGRMQPRYQLSNIRYFIEQLNSYLYTLVSESKNTYFIDLEEIVSTFGKKYFQDDYLTHSNHGSVVGNIRTKADMARLEPTGSVDELYTPNVGKYIRAIFEESLAIRKTIRQTDGIKLVIFDLDDTLWRGVAAELHDADPELVEGWPLGIVEAALREFMRSSRRTFTKELSIITTGSVISQILPHSVAASDSICSYPMRSAPVVMPSLDSRLVNPELIRGGFRTPDNTYFTYPHANGFLDDSTAVIASRSLEGVNTYSSLDLVSGIIQPLAELAGKPRAYYAISPVSKMMVVPMNDGIVSIDLRTRKSARIATFPGWKVVGDIDIHPEGNFVVSACWNLSDPRHTRVYIVPIQGGEAVPIYDTVGMRLDHAHFSPHDPNWIQFSDGTPHSLQRMWVCQWGATPQIKTIFQQKRGNGTRYDIGHERAMFNEAAAIVICFAGSKECPLGLYKVSYENGESRLISEANRDSHCNISRDGRFAVVSEFLDGDLSQNAHVLNLCLPTPTNWTDDPSATIDGNWNRNYYVDSDITLVDMISGMRQFVMRGTNAINNKNSLQPWEVHPAVSPSGRWLLCKDGKTRSVFVLEINQDSLNRSLEDLSK